MVGWEGMDWDGTGSKLFLGRVFIFKGLTNRKKKKIMFILIIMIMFAEEFGGKPYRSSLNCCHLGTVVPCGKEAPPALECCWHGSIHSLVGSVQVSSRTGAKAAWSCLRKRVRENRKCAEITLSHGLAPCKLTVLFCTASVFCVLFSGLGLLVDSLGVSRLR